MSVGGESDDDRNKFVRNGRQHELTQRPAVRVPARGRAVCPTQRHHRLRPTGGDSVGSATSWTLEGLGALSTRQIPPASPAVLHVSDQGSPTCDQSLVVG